MNTRRIEPKQTRAKNTLQKIKNSTLELLEQHSYADTTTNMIARKANISIGSLYKYFPNKEALLRELALDQLKELEEIALKTVKENYDESPHTLTTRMLNDYLVPLINASPSASLLFLSFVQDDDATAEVISQLKEAMKTYFIYNRDTFAIENPELTAHALGSGIFGIIKSHLLGEHQFTTEEIATEIVSIINARIYYQKRD